MRETYNRNSDDIVKARLYYDFMEPKASARKINFNIRIFIILSSAYLIGYLSLKLFVTLSYFLSSLSYFFKIFLTFKNFHTDSITNFEDRDFNYPIYSVMIALYNEPSKIKSLLAACKNLDYPKDKLEVFMLIEKDDQITLRAIKVEYIPSYIKIIIVPPMEPFTKPKALNYGLCFTNGEFITIYDAEDAPEALQLKKAIYQFRRLPEKYVCLQSKLRFYNRNETIITWYLGLEYEVWFNIILPGLSNYDLPVTLGGTSNHIKAKVLKNLGGWDPYNVTEDAELGLRLYAKGFRTAMLDSFTEEEAVIDCKSWIFQRSRWIKGFIKTYFSWRNRVKFYNKMPLKIRLVVDIFVGFSSLNFLMMPIILVLSFISPNERFFGIIFKMDLCLYLTFCYLSTIVVIYKYNKIQYLNLKTLLMIILWPFYFILHSIAAWIAIYELISAPFKWNKTEHGLTSYQIIKEND